MFISQCTHIKGSIFFLYFRGFFYKCKRPDFYLMTICSLLRVLVFSSVIWFLSSPVLIQHQLWYVLLFRLNSSNLTCMCLVHLLYLCISWQFVINCTYVVWSLVCQMDFILYSPVSMACLTLHLWKHNVIYVFCLYSWGCHRCLSELGESTNNTV